MVSQLIEIRYVLLRESLFINLSVFAVVDMCVVGSHPLHEEAVNRTRDSDKSTNTIIQPGSPRMPPTSESSDLGRQDLPVGRLKRMSWTGPAIITCATQAKISHLSNPIHARPSSSSPTTLPHPVLLPGSRSPSNT